MRIVIIFTEQDRYPADADATRSAQTPDGLGYLSRIGGVAPTARKGEGPKPILTGPRSKLIIEIPHSIVQRVAIQSKRIIRRTVRLLVLVRLHLVSLVIFPLRWRLRFFLRLDRNRLLFRFRFNGFDSWCNRRRRLERNFELSTTGAGSRTSAAHRVGHFESGCRRSLHSERSLSTRARNS
jgi:hypothetical protein